MGFGLGLLGLGVFLVVVALLVGWSKWRDLEAGVENIKLGYASEMREAGIPESVLSGIISHWYAPGSQMDSLGEEQRRIAHIAWVTADSVMESRQLSAAFDRMLLRMYVVFGVAIAAAGLGFILIVKIVESLGS